MTPNRLNEIRALCDADSGHDHELLFDPSECGGAGWFGYYGLMTDYQSPSDILIRIDKKDDDNATKTKALANQVVARWNAIPELLDEIERLQRLAYHKYCITYQDLFAASVGMADEAEDLKSENERLREVLRFYADRSNYKGLFDFDDEPTLAPVYEDEGQRGRKVLGDE